MAQFSTQGGKGVLAPSALLSCEYSSEKLHFIVCGGRSSVALALLCTGTPGVSQERPAAKLGSLMSLLGRLESLEFDLSEVFPPYTNCSVLVHFRLEF